MFTTLLKELFGILVKEIVNAIFAQLARPDEVELPHDTYLPGGRVSDRDDILARFGGVLGRET